MTGNNLIHDWNDLSYTSLNVWPLCYRWKLMRGLEIRNYFHAVLTFWWWGQNSVGLIDPENTGCVKLYKWTPSLGQNWVLCISWIKKIYSWARLLKPKENRTKKMILNVILWEDLLRQTLCYHSCLRTHHLCELSRFSERWAQRFSYKNDHSDLITT